MGQQANFVKKKLRPVKLMTPWDVVTHCEGLFTYYVSHEGVGEGSANADKCRRREERVNCRRRVGLDKLARLTVIWNSRIGGRTAMLSRLANC